MCSHNDNLEYKHPVVIDRRWLQIIQIRLAMKWSGYCKILTRSAKVEINLSRMIKSVPNIRTYVIFTCVNLSCHLKHYHYHQHHYSHQYHYYNHNYRHSDCLIIKCLVYLISKKERKKVLTYLIAFSLIISIIIIIKEQREEQEKGYPYWLYATKHLAVQLDA